MSLDIQKFSFEFAVVIPKPYWKVTGGVGNEVKHAGKEGTILASTPVTIKYG